MAWAGNVDDDKQLHQVTELVQNFIDDYYVIVGKFPISLTIDPSNDSFIVEDVDG